MITYLEFEKPVAELETRIKELKASAGEGAVNIDAEVKKLLVPVKHTITVTPAK